MHSTLKLLFFILHVSSSCPLLLSRQCGWVLMLLPGAIEITCKGRKREERENKEWERCQLGRLNIQLFQNLLFGSGNCD